MYNRRTILMALSLAAVAVPAFADEWPSKPIRLVVPFPAGGGPDAMARDVANKVTESTKWTFVVENRPGAGGNTGIDTVAKSRPDGYSIVLGQTANVAINATLYPKLPYDPVNDLTAIATIGTSPMVIVASAKAPYRTWADVVAAAKKKPDGLNFATSGNGTVAHLIGVELTKQAGIRLTHVPYKGVSMGINDVLGGNVELYISSMPTLIGFIRSGKVRAIAVTSSKRLPELPDVQTLGESGYKVVEYANWFGFFGPAKLPANITARLNAEFNKALQSPEVRRKLQAQGMDVAVSFPDAFAKLVRDDVVRWSKVVRETGARVE